MHLARQMENLSTKMLSIQRLKQINKNVAKLIEELEKRKVLKKDVKCLRKQL